MDVKRDGSEWCEMIKWMHEEHISGYNDHFVQSGRSDPMEYSSQVLIVHILRKCT